MTFSWPYLLLLLLLVPALVALYVWLQRRRRKFAVRFASLSLIREALPRHSHWRRHLPFALLLASIASLVVAAARPQAVVAVPSNRTSVILALDVSLSMCSTDVEPNRLAVAKDVARSFIEDQPGGTRMGLVVFAGYAQLVVPPTTDKDLLLAAIDGLVTGRGTAIGSALLKAVDAIAEVNPDVVRIGVNTGDGSAKGPTSAAGYEPDVVVLLTDGATTQGVDPVVAAEQAVERRVRVFTIGFGTEEPAPLVCSRSQLGGDTIPGRLATGGPGGQAGLRNALVRDEATLRTVAEMTGGTYHRAEDAEQLERVFGNLPAEISRQDEEREISVAFVALGAALAVAAVGLSLAWNRFP